MDLPGHGATAPLPSGYLRPRFARIVLVAHSAGGGSASAAVERHPDLADHLVYLSAFVPAGRPRFSGYTTAPENAGAAATPHVGDPAAIGAFRINPLPDAAAEELRRVFLTDWPAGRPSWRLTLHPDEPLESPAAPVRVTPGRWGRVPRTYVRLTGDRALALAAQDLMIAEADAAAPEHPCTVHDLPGGHSPFRTRPGDLAAVLAPVVHPV